MLTWQIAAFGAAFLLVAGFAAKRFAHRGVVRAAGPFVHEAGIVLALYALWQTAGEVSLDHADDAVGRGGWIWHTERAWHLPSEKWVQGGILHHPILVQACNYYYATMHFGMLIAALLWLFGRHRDVYPRVRTTLVLTTTGCLLVALMPVAPPRLLQVGMVDTATAYGQSVYTGGIGADQYSAMPSVHVAWAALLSIAVIAASTSKWRWLILVHFAATVYVVVVTANHFWADGIVAIAVLGASLGVQALARLTWARLRVRLLYRSTAGLDVGRDEDISVR
jgi:hypothetical protein